MYVVFRMPSSCGCLLLFWGIQSVHFLSSEKRPAWSPVVWRDHYQELGVGDDMGSGSRDGDKGGGWGGSERGWQGGGFLI